MPMNSETTTASGASAVKVFWLIREASTPKLSPRATGLITYQILTDQDRQAVFLRIAGNEGGGHFSDEAVPLRTLRACIEDQPAGESIRAAVLKTAFVGRSSNQPPFGAAVLLAEGLLTRDSDRAGYLRDGLSWDGWIQAQLDAAVGALAQITVGKPPVSRKMPANTEVDPTGPASGDNPADGDDTSTPTVGINTSSDLDAVQPSSSVTDDPGQTPLDESPAFLEPRTKKGRMRGSRGNQAGAT